MDAQLADERTKVSRVDNGGLVEEAASTRQQSSVLFLYQAVEWFYWSKANEVCLHRDPGLVGLGKGCVCLDFNSNTRRPQRKCLQHQDKILSFVGRRECHQAPNKLRHRVDRQELAERYIELL